MFLQTKIQENIYTRRNKLGKKHLYTRKKTIAVFVCDNCDQIFFRELKKIDRKRLNNNYFHCCSQCDYKRFAQKIGVQRKQMWNLLANSDVLISKF